MERENKNIILYRALSDHEIQLSSTRKGDLLSEGMSRVIGSSMLNKSPYFFCFSEDPRKAIHYSKKPGYSGKIGAITVEVGDNGRLSAVDQDSYTEVYRTWNMVDWLQLAKLSDWPDYATNVNYQTRPTKKITDIITYRGRMAARAFAHSDRSFIVHASGPLKYTILNNDEIQGISGKKRIIYKSFKMIEYNFTDDHSQKAIKKLIKAFEQEDNTKAYTRLMIEQLETLVK